MNEPPTQVFCCKHCEIFKSTFFEEHLRKAASEAVVQRCSVKKVFLKISQNSQENNRTRASFLNKVKKEALARACSCEFYEIFTNTFFIEHLWRLLLLLAVNYFQYFHKTPHYVCLTWA